jgi:hypothetical protein
MPKKEYWADQDHERGEAMSMTRQPIKPDPQDYEAIAREEGPLPANASDAEVAHRYRLALAAKFIRLYEQGKLEDDDA